MVSLLLPLVILLAGIGCVKPPEAPPPPPPPPSVTPGAEVALELTVENTSFDKKTLTVAASAPVKVLFASKEQPLDYHNLAIFKDRTAKEPIFVGEYIDGGESITYRFTAPSIPGSYFFRCDTHPFLMNGQFIVR
ncbi:MAG: hypothetical protein HYX80_07020 [Chloroflexi bacterium]|nr:hypothetical protein [Chloroflexota bacterium]